MDVTPELAELSRTVDMGVLGRRIRAARVAAGLTQTQLASPDASTTYLSRIENGDRRPDLRLLVRFAEKTRVTLDELVVGLSRDQVAELRVHLDLAAASLAVGDPATALDELRQVGHAHDAGLPADLAAQARFLAALAHQALGSLDDAIISLEHTVEAGPAERGWLPSSVALARCYLEAGEPDRALQVGEPALALLGRLGLGLSTPAVALASSVTEASLALGDRARAAAIYADLVPHLDVDARSMVEAHREAALTALAEGQVHLASYLADAARGLGAPVGDRETDAARLRVGLARERLLDGDTRSTAQLLTAPIDPRREPVLAASRHLVLGHVQLRTGAPAEAQASFELAASALEHAGRRRAAAQVWFDLATAFAELGDRAASGNAYRRAAASTGLATSSSGLDRARV